MIFGGIDVSNIKKFIVFDRWGNEVFKRLNYKTNRLWTGKYRTLDVPDGTYYYMFKYGEGEMKVGFVQIQR